MPMYFPDLKSIQQLAKDMSKHQELKNKYKGIIPQTEEELPQARKELAQYMREVWHDEVFAIEIEEEVSKENYEDKMTKAIKCQFIRKAFESLSDHEKENLRGLGNCPF